MILRAWVYMNSNSVSVNENVEPEHLSVLNDSSEAKAGNSQGLAMRVELSDDCLAFDRLRQ